MWARGLRRRPLGNKKTHMFTYSVLLWRDRKSIWSKIQLHHDRHVSKARPILIIVKHGFLVGLIRRFFSSDVSDTPRNNTIFGRILRKVGCTFTFPYTIIWPAAPRSIKSNTFWWINECLAPQEIPADIVHEDEHCVAFRGMTLPNCTDTYGGFGLKTSCTNYFRCRSPSSRSYSDNTPQTYSQGKS